MASGWARARNGEAPCLRTVAPDRRRWRGPDDVQERDTLGRSYQRPMGIRKKKNGRNGHKSYNVSDIERRITSGRIFERISAPVQWPELASVLLYTALSLYPKTKEAALTRKPNGLFLPPLFCSDTLYRSSAA